MPYLQGSSAEAWSDSVLVKTRGPIQPSWHRDLMPKVWVMAEHTSCWHRSHNHARYTNYALSNWAKSAKVSLTACYVRLPWCLGLVNLKHPWETDQSLRPGRYSFSKLGHHYFIPIWISEILSKQEKDSKARTWLNLQNFPEPRSHWNDSYGSLPTQYSVILWFSESPYHLQEWALQVSTSKWEKKQYLHDLFYSR